MKEIPRCCRYHYFRYKERLKQVYLFLGCLWKAKYLNYNADIYIGQDFTKDVCCLKCKGLLLDGKDVKAALLNIQYGYCTCILETYTTKPSENYVYAELSGTDPGNCTGIYINICI